MFVQSQFHPCYTCEPLGIEKLKRLAILGSSAASNAFFIASRSSICPLFFPRPLSDFERAILDDEPTLMLEMAADVSLDMDWGDDVFVFDEEEEADKEEEPEEPNVDAD
ncbi:hypothetical protein IW261DRAFT_1611342 [Armillaria novae-zelandiae]|uniref:Uncharacterized protein n=1 Tax=Armillaria novae-zelandiae TaxID=153914 RepID=A0AA39TXQ1_9AGAR|nr:hypothetical protein IW261DRAFT_1611342 [Armillaria novae-zelandiae]